MGKQNWKAGNMLNPVPAVMVTVADEDGRANIITVAAIRMSHTVTSRETVLTVSTQIDSVCRLLFRDTLIPD